MSDLNNLSRDLNRLANDLLQQKTLNRIGLGQLRQIRKRTREGKDVEGDTFEPYSEAHAKRREKKSLSTGTVDLQFSLYETMLGTADHEVDLDDGTVQLYFTDSDKEQLAIYHNVDGAGKSKVKRKFWGISDEEEDAIAEIIREDLNEQLQLLNLT